MAANLSDSGADPVFPPTQWTVIVEAVSRNPAHAAEALERLCAIYRQPIVSWFRRKDYYQDPEDLAHSFVAYLLEKDLLHKVAPRTGKFRAFLAVTMRNFLRDTWDKARAQKRGRDVEKVSFGDNDVDIAADGHVDSLLDADFALDIHRRVLASLAPAEDLWRYIFEKDAGEGWEGVGARFGKSSAAIRKEVSRLRRAHWERFRDEVAEIVATPSERAEETRYLYEVLFRHWPNAG